MRLPTAPHQNPKPLPPIVLLVEDDASTREMYEAALAAEGLWVAEASNAGQALQYASELRPNAVVTDISLNGGLEGLFLAEQLREHPKLSDVPVVAVTGLDPETLAGRTGLFAAVFEKPVVCGHLVRGVRSAIARSAGLRERAGVRPVREHIGTSPRRLQRSGEIAITHAERMQPARNCPRCGQSLQWVDRRTMDGLLFDYFEPCTQGCGLFCYDHSLRRVVSLIE